MKSDGEAARPANGSPRLRPGEEIRDRVAVNAVQHDRTFGGHLYVTSRRLIFVPNPYGRSRGAARFETRFKEVTEIVLAPRGRTIWDGSWRRRVRVTTRTGQTAYFIAWRPRQMLALIERARSGAQPS